MIKNNWVFLLIIFFFLSQFLYAQDTLEFSDQKDIINYAGKLVPERLLERTSVNFDDVPLQFALNTLSNDHDIHLSYNDVSTPLSKKVNLHLENVFVLEALLGILKQTGMALMVTKGGNLVIANDSKNQTSASNNRSDRSANAIITGTVIDKNSGDLLPGANIVLAGTQSGAATDLNGEFTIRAVRPGKYSVTVTYIGYRSKTIEINVTAGQKNVLKIELETEIVQGEVVTITAQAAGQTAAINQQIAANSIKNVVSSARIQELPDATAAESVGRLPGISINRAGGEANKVTIRGLAPRFNNVQIEGVRMGSTDIDNRSTDMSMIAPNALAGIEVTKALLPDMDANSLGGTVNLTIQEAHTGFHTDLLIQGGYDSQKESYDNYKIVASASNRFFENKFGVYLNTYIEKRDRSTDTVNPDFMEDYTLPEKDRDKSLEFEQIEFKRQAENKDRIGATLVFDYKLPSGSLKFSNFASKMNRNILTHRQTYEGRLGTRYHADITKGGDYFQIQAINRLAGELNIFSGKLDFALSHSLAERDQPDSRWIGEWGLYELSEALRDSLHYLDYVNHVGDFSINGKDFKMSGVEKTKISGTDRLYSGDLNFSRSFRIGNFITGNFKFGGKYSHQMRKFDVEEHYIDIDRNDYSNIGEVLLNLMPDVFTHQNYVYEVYPKDSWDNHFDNSKFFDGKYHLKPFMNLDIFDRVQKECWAYYERNGLIYERKSNSFIKDQDGTEETKAAYIMSEFRMLDNKISFIPGVRYENVNYNYKGFIWQELDKPEGTEWRDLSKPDTAQTTHKNWFPMTHLRYKPNDWFDVRLAYTNTVSRPNYTDLLPYLVYVPLTYQAEGGNPLLKPQLSENWDFYISAYSNHLGLLSAGVFQKTLTDLIWRSSYYLPTEEDAIDFGLTEYFKGWTYSSAQNSKYKGTLKGFEVSWQDYFWFLPFPFNGTVLDLNYTYIHSKTRYPLPLKERIPGSRPPKFTRIDSSYTGPIEGQPKHVINVSVGYDYKGFSGRVSYLYQSGSTYNVNVKPYLNTYSFPYSRWDIKLMQKVVRNMEVFLNLSNITNSPDETYMQRINFLDTRETWGTTIDIGLRYRF